MFYERTTLEDGLTVLSEGMPTMRSVAIGVWLAVGSRDELPSEAGMSHFLEHMSFKGTPTRTAQEISETFDKLGAELNAFTSKEYTCYYARVLDEHVDVALDVLSDMVSSSLLADDACDNEREVVLEEIARAEDTPDDRVHELFASALWPAHPLGRPVLGTAEAVRTFDHAASRGYRSRHYVTGNAVVAAAGNLSHEECVSLVRDRLRLPAGPRAARPAADSDGARRLAVVTKETEQAHICYGFKGLHARHEDRFVLSMIDTVLGGGMSSRLFQEIREKRGLAYAVYSYSTLYEDTGQLTVYAGTRPDNAGEVLRLIQEEVARVAADGLTDEEIHRAKESIKGHIVLGMESTRNRMTRLGKGEVTHGDILSLDEIVSRIDSVEPSDITRVAGQLLTGAATLALIGPITEESLSATFE